MTIHYADKILLITRHNRLHSNLKQILNNYKLDIAENYLNLFSIDLIRKAVHSTKNTTFIRTELLRFIREQGIPRFIALDIQIDTSEDGESDHDKMKILRTFLISFIILSRGKGFEDLRCNLILIGDNAVKKILSQIESQPHRILDVLSTSDSKVNSFIEELKKDRDRFNRIFFIKALNSDETLKETQFIIDNYIKAIKARENLIRPGSRGMTIDSSEQNAASVIYRIDEDRVYVDGEVRDIDSDDLRKLETERFYIVGPWVNKTQVQVSDKITNAILRGLSSEKGFRQDDEIIIDMTDRCSVDATTTPSLAQVLSNSLASYRNISIHISSKNDAILSEAKGYSLIKKSLRVG